MLVMSNAISIFLVDDDKDDQKVFKMALSAINTQVHLSVYNSGKDLLGGLYKDSKKPDVFFLDLYMSRMDGEECLIEIRKKKELNEIPVVIYSTEYDLTRIEKLFALGANRYLRKPESFNSLIISIEKTISSIKRNAYGGAALINIVA